MADARGRVDAVLERWAAHSERFWPSPVAAAVRYSLLSTGKRLRPTLVVACYEAVGGGSPAVVELAAAVEVVHAYSLVHDDLPCMDNDDLRRGRPTTHRAFDVRTATEAGYHMVALAARVLAAGMDALELDVERRHQVHARVDQEIDRDQHPDQDSGHDPRQEQPRHRLLRRYAVDDHGDRWRDDGGDGAAGSDQAAGEHRRVAALGQLRNHEPADRGDAADARAGHRAKQLRRGDRRQGERAAHPANDREHPFDQPAGDAAAAHDLAGEDEQRYRQQREVVEAAEQRAMDRLHGADVEHDDADGGGGDQGREDRHAETQQRHRQDDEREDCHQPGSGSGSCASRPSGTGSYSHSRISAITIIRNNAAGTIPCGIHIGRCMASLR